MTISDDDLRRLLSDLETNLPDWARSWRRSVADFLDEIAKADVTIRSSREFQHRLWNDNPITSTGMGQVDVTAALDDDSFRRWLAEISLQPVPTVEAAKLSRLTEMLGVMRERFQHQRMPNLKMYRVLAAFYPDDLTCLSFTTRLYEYAVLVLERPPQHALEQHLAICRRFDRVMGPVKVDSASRAARLTAHWLVYEQLRSKGDEETIEVVTGSTRLKPLPAARRRKGLLAFRGYSRAVLGILQSVGDGITREDFLDAARDEIPEYKDSSLINVLSTLQGGLGVLARYGSLYKLTPAGKSLLENDDPDALSEWLLTRVLGIDVAVAALRDRGPLPASELYKALREANPGWTTDFAPSTIVSWLADLEVIEQLEGRWRLSERGSRWATQIHWQPMSIEPTASIIDILNQNSSEQAPEAGSEARANTVEIPAFNDIVARVGSHFSRAIVAQLHAGLWSRDLRHFAVLAGLSGSGKTELARRYATALTDDDSRVEPPPVWWTPEMRRKWRSRCPSRRRRSASGVTTRLSSRPRSSRWSRPATRRSARSRGISI
jgi:5-methylcytosine-specific restriction protein B